MHSFSALTWLQRLCGVRHAEEPPSTPWERYPAPQERNIPCVIHQREQPEYQPEPDRPFLAWRDQQRVLRPRLITDTGPKVIERAGHEQAIEPVVVRKVDTEGMRRLGLRTPIPETRALVPAELPSFLQAKVPGMPSGALPIERQDLLATLRASHPRNELSKPPVYDLPTVPNRDGIVSGMLRALPPWDPAPEPTSPPSGWLTDDGPQVEFGTLPEVESETDGEIPTQKLVPELRYTMQNAPTQPDEFPALRQLVRLAKLKQESEK